MSRCCTTTTEINCECQLFRTFSLAHLTTVGYTEFGAWTQSFWLAAKKFEAWQRDARVSFALSHAPCLLAIPFGAFYVCFLMYCFHQCFPNEFPRDSPRCAAIFQNCERLCWTYCMYTTFPKRSFLSVTFQSLALLCRSQKTLGTNGLSNASKTHVKGTEENSKQARSVRDFFPRMELLTLSRAFGSLKMRKVNHFSLFCKSCFVLFLTLIMALRFHAAP